MPRSMSFWLTQDQFRAQTKRVTRRQGWAFAKVGDVYNGVEKGQGIPKGGHVVRMNQIRVEDERWERLDTITQEEVALEGFPDETPEWFVAMYCKANRCQPDHRVHRIEYSYRFEIQVCDDGEDWVVWDNLRGGFLSRLDEDMEPCAIVYMRREDAERAAAAGKPLDQVAECGDCGALDLWHRIHNNRGCMTCGSQRGSGLNRWEPLGWTP